MPRIGTAIRYFETKLGMLRRELDADALLQLFDDPKLARCLVDCLGRSYRYRTQRLADVFGEQRAAALLERGIAVPRDLRAWAYTRANETGGFVPPPTARRFLAELTPELDLVETEQALWLDAADQAMLMRVGPTPTTEEVLALYHLRVVDSLLRVASTARFWAARRPRHRRGCLRAAWREVRIVGDEVTFHGKQDSVGPWVRHGARLARAALILLGDGALGSGEAIVPFGDEAFDVAAGRRVPAGGAAAARLVGAGRDLGAAGGADRRADGRATAGPLAGWRLRRWPEPIVAEGAVLWPEISRRAAVSRSGCCR